ncbi:ABC transporter ATP-binding protein [Streptosporangium amethystogenes]|uniref:ABC transporter ATP-binding protein n=1 Tax=Streptosporangium amethystogenes TaxID=2002 RepID=UPI0037983A69
MSYQGVEKIGSKDTIRTLIAAFSLSIRSAPLLLTGYCLLSIVEALIPVAVAWSMKLIIDGVVAGVSQESFVGNVALFIGLSLLAAALSNADSYLSAQMSRAFRINAQETLHRSIDKFHGLRYFEDPHLLDRIRMAQNASSSAPEEIIRTSVLIIRTIVQAAGFSAVLFTVGPALVVLSLVSVMPIFWLELRMTRANANRMWQASPIERRELFFRGLLTSHKAAKEIRLFRAGSFLIDRMINERREANKLASATDKQRFLGQTATSVITIISTSAGLVWGAFSAYRGEISVGDMSLLLTAIGSLQGVLGGFAISIANGHKSLLMFHYYVLLLKMPSDISIPALPAAIPPLTKGIVFDNVWFRYSPDHPWVLRGVNLEITAGRSVGIVGVNGVGKSTLVKLLCRFYDPTKGRILWDGIDLRNLDPEMLRSRLGAHFQDYMEYELTAGENIGIGHLDALSDEHAISDAARRAEIYNDIISLPAGFDTILSRNFFQKSSNEQGQLSGVVLSGGQWQRLALARALMKANADLVILDEPSSALDAEAEYQISKRLAELRTGRTSVLISHRLGTLRDIDEIVVLSSGVVCERGSHDNLMEIQGEYWRLFNLQASAYAELGRVDKDHIGSA